MLVSEYGDLLNIRPVSRSRSSKTGKTDLREVRMICDNTEAKTLLKQLKGNQSTFFLFNPSQAHYTNARTLFSALKKLVNNESYGVISKKQKEKLDERFGED